MTGTWRTLRDFPPSVRLLVANQLGVNLGFYLLLPYLAGYLADDVGMSAAVIGLILGVRNLSQQGLFLLGGSAADRLGTRGVIIAGCALRTVGFAAFAAGTSLPVLLAASVLSGLAGALFNPAVRAYLAQAAAPDRRAEAFALFNVSANAGALLGPVIGSVLLLVDFRLAALTAAGVFAALTVAQVFALPAQPRASSGQSVLGDWRECLSDRRFLAFTLALSGMFALQNQLYLVLPMQAEHATGQPVAVAALFVAATTLTLLAQVPVTRGLRRRHGSGAAIAAGLAVMGVGFLLPLLPVPGPSAAADGSTGGVAVAGLGLLPVLCTALLLTAGVMIAQPFVLELIPAFARDGLTGTYFGVFYLVSGVVAAAGTAAVGWATDARGGGVAPAAWLLCAGSGLACACAVWLLRRRGLLTPAGSAGVNAVGITAPVPSASLPGSGGGVR